MTVNKEKMIVEFICVALKAPTLSLFSFFARTQAQWHTTLNNVHHLFCWTIVDGSAFASCSLEDISHRIIRVDFYYIAQGNRTEQSSLMGYFSCMCFCCRSLECSRFVRFSSFTVFCLHSVNSILFVSFFLPSLPNRCTTHQAIFDNYYILFFFWLIGSTEIIPLVGFNDK